MSSQWTWHLSRKHGDGSVPTAGSAPHVLSGKWRTHHFRAKCISGGRCARHCSTLLRKQVLPSLCSPTPTSRPRPACMLSDGCGPPLSYGPGGAQVSARPSSRTATATVGRSHMLLVEGIQGARKVQGSFQQSGGCLPAYTRPLCPTHRHAVLHFSTQSLSVDKFNGLGSRVRV